MLDPEIKSLISEFDKLTTPEELSGLLNRADLYAAYKDWCAANRHNPVSAHRLYTSVWDIFRVKTHNSHGRRLFKGIRLIPETPQTGAEGADREQK